MHVMILDKILEFYNVIGQRDHDCADLTGLSEFQETFSQSALTDRAWQNEFEIPSKASERFQQSF